MYMYISILTISLCVWGGGGDGQTLIRDEWLTLVFVRVHLHAYFRYTIYNSFNLCFLGEELLITKGFFFCTDYSLSNNPYHSSNTTCTLILSRMIMLSFDRMTHLQQWDKNNHSCMRFFPIGNIMKV